MGTATRFWNWNAERYARQAIADQASYQKKLAITQSYLTPDMRVVEFGCGTGSTAIVHAPKVKTYEAIDVSEKMVEIGRGKAAEAGLSNLRFTVGTLEEVGAPDASCDAILGLNILHLVPDLDGTIATVARMLEPGGHFFSSTICLKNLQGGLRLLGLATRVLPFLPTVSSFSVEDLETILKNAGFAIDERFEQRPGVVFLVTVKQ
ncbi:MAG: class I SAM-dependent methyltransferase [Deltaproteobacteria bacterium]|nr:class I SAM-dependent methyltransferase [Deltaproteobacteria bacterium]